MEFYITLDNPTQVFQPGAIVSGMTTLKLKDTCSARYVIISVEGEAHNRWSVSKSRTVTVNGKTTTQTYQITHSSRVTYARGESFAWGNGQKEKLQVGEHKFPFSFQIPLNCAPSFEGCYGHIRYHCKAIVDRPWKFNHVCKQPFTVIPQFNLNTIPNLFNPVTNAVCENTGVMLFRKGKVEMTISIPRGGFVPGEHIPVTFNIMNMSKKSVKKVEVRLWEYSDYYAPSGCNEFPPSAVVSRCGSMDNNRRERRKAVEAFLPLHVPRDGKASETINLRIPPCVSTFNTCPIIQVSYMLDVKVHTESAFNNTIATGVPVVIGTIPLMAGPPRPMAIAGNPTSPPYPGASGSTSAYPALPNVAGANGQYASAPPLLPSPGDGPAPPYDASMAPPPSYEESIFGAGVGVPGDDGEKGQAFAPRYVYYNMNSQPQPQTLPHTQLPPQVPPPPTVPQPPLPDTATKM